MANPTAANRYYSTPPVGPHSMAAFYVWSDTAVNSGAATPVTGNWVASVPYTDNFSFVTGGNTLSIPVGARTWSVNVISGSAFMNNTGAIPGGVILNGGLGAFGQTATPLVVSGQGASKILVQWTV